jgi:hypothetical protein
MHFAKCSQACPAPVLVTLTNDEVNQSRAGGSHNHPVVLVHEATGTGTIDNQIGYNNAPLVARGLVNDAHTPVRLSGISLSLSSLLTAAAKASFCWEYGLITSTLIF